MFSKDSSVPIWKYSKTENEEAFIRFLFQQMENIWQQVLSKDDGVMLFSNDVDLDLQFFHTVLIAALKRYSIPI